MFIGILIAVLLLSMKLNGITEAPWWLVIISIFFSLVVGMVTSGSLKFKIERRGE